jgi:hypothetical protein
MSRKQSNLSIEEFKNFLNLYGSDFARWPEYARDFATDMVERSEELHKMVEEERRFEQTLNLREIESPGSGLEDRIIASARKGSGSVSRSFFCYLGDIFKSFYLPSPAFSLALILVIGILIGYFTSSVNSVNGDDQLITSQLTFYEGEIYEFED